MHRRKGNRKPPAPSKVQRRVVVASLQEEKLPCETSTVAAFTPPAEQEVHGTSSQRSFLDSRGAHLFLLLCVPALILVRQTNPVFTAPGSIDPWVYLGFFENLVNFKRVLFPMTYYGSRLSWILPGYVVHAIFSPVVANYVMHLGVYLTAVGSLYSVVSQAINRRTGFLTAAAFGFYPYVWAAMGWDYVDGVGIAYYLGTMAALSKAAGGESRRAALAIAGVLAAGLIYSNIFWCVLAPLLVAYYFCVVWLKERQIRSRVVPFLLCFSAGFLAATAFLGGINYLVDGKFWFYWPSIGFAIAFANVPNPWAREPFYWILTPWLKFPAVTLAAGLPVLVWRISRSSFQASAFRVLLFAQFVATFAILVWMQARGNPALTFSYYASYLIPATFLAIGAVFLEVPDGLTDRKFTVLVLWLFLAFGVTWWLHDCPAWLRWDEGTHLARAIPAAALLLAAGLLQGPRMASLLVVVAGLGVLTFNVRINYPADPNYYGDAYTRVMTTRRNIEDRRRGRAVRFWYKVSEQAGNEFTALSSTYLWGYTILTEKFPALPPGADIRPGMLLVVLSGDRLAPELAAQGLKERGLVAGLEGKLDIHENSASYSVFFFVPERLAEQ